MTRLACARHRPRACCWPCMPAICCQHAARTSTGVVTHVTDGDTLWVRPASGGAPRQVRLQGIDAPEICQAFGSRGARRAGARVLHRQRQGREPRAATTTSARSATSAWAAGPGPGWSAAATHGRTASAATPVPMRSRKRRAKRAGLGLWRGSSPVSPREFRKRHGSCPRNQDRRRMATMTPAQSAAAPARDAAQRALHAVASGALHRAGFRLRPVAGGAGHRRHAVGLAGLRRAAELAVPRCHRPGDRCRRWPSAGGPAP